MAAPLAIPAALWRAYRAAKMIYWFVTDGWDYIDGTLLTVPDDHPALLERRGTTHTGGVVSPMQVVELDYELPAHVYDLFMEHGMVTEYHMR